MLAFVRELEDERVLVVANLSRFVQYVQLDLKEYAGVVPEEVLGRTRFPPITDAPYLLTLGPHAFIWFSLPVAAAPPEASAGATENRCGRAAGVHRLAVAGSSDFSRPTGTTSKYCFRSTSTPPAARRRDRASPLARFSTSPRFSSMRSRSTSVIVRVEPRGGVGEIVSLPLAFVPADQHRPAPGAARGGLVRRDLRAGARRALRCTCRAGCCRGLLGEILTGRSQQADGGEIEAVPD